MKHSLTILCIAIAATSLLSCNKNKEDIIKEPVVPAGPKLTAVLKFDGNVSDSTNQIFLNGAAGIATYTTDHKGNPNGAKVFDGSASLEYYDVPVSGKSITMSAWLKVPNVSLGAQDFISLQFSGASSFTIYQTGMHYGTSVSVPGTNSIESSEVDNNWHHFATTYDGKDIKVYIDGKLSGTMPHAGSFGDGKRQLVIGSYKGVFWNGIIDELRIYEGILNQEAIAQLAAL